MANVNRTLPYKEQLYWLEAERQMLGVTLSAHPLDCHADAVAAVSPTHMAVDFQEVKNGTPSRVVGLAYEYKEKLQGRRSVAKWRLEDKSGSVACVALGPVVPRDRVACLLSAPLVVSGAFEEGEIRVASAVSLDVLSVSRGEDLVGRVATTLQKSRAKGKMWDVVLKLWPSDPSGQYRYRALAGLGVGDEAAFAQQFVAAGSDGRCIAPVELKSGKYGWREMSTKAGLSAEADAYFDNIKEVAKSELKELKKQYSALKRQSKKDKQPAPLWSQFLAGQI